MSRYRGSENSDWRKGSSSVSQVRRVQVQTSILENGVQIWSRSSEIKKEVGCESTSTKWKYDVVECGRGLS